MTDHYLADDADSRTVWNDGCIVPQIISLFRQRMAALFVPYCINNMPTIGFFPRSMVRAKKATSVSMPQPFLKSGVSFHFVWGLEEMKRGRGANSRGLCHLRLLNQPNFSLSTLNALCDIERWSFTLTLNQCIAMCYCTLHYWTTWSSLRYNLIGSHYSLSLCSFPEVQFPAVD